MSDPVTLLVPVDASYRALGPELARKYLEIVGGSESDAHELSESLATALPGLIQGAAAGAGLALALSVDAGVVQVRLSCGDRTTLITQPVPARKSS